MSNSSLYSIRHRIIRPAGTAIASMAMIGGSLMIAVGPASADPTNQYNLNQCANGGKGTLVNCSASAYQNGDLHSTNSHWAEGDFVPFQLVLTNVTAGSHTLTLQYEAVNGGKHAYDYLGSFDATETTSSQSTPAHANGNNPCLDSKGSTWVIGCDPTAPTSTLGITAPDLTGVNAACGSAGTPPTLPTTTGLFSLWGPTNSKLDSMSYEPLQPVQQGKTITDCHSLIDLNFTSPADGTTMVLAWGAHVASSLDWQAPNSSAGSINGAPYHMWIDGVQQRSMQVSSLQTTLSTVIEDAAGTPVTSVPVNTPVHDTATLGGASSTAGGTVTYTFFNSSDCSGQAVAPVSTVNVSKGIVPDSSTFTPSTASSYSFLATYSGDPGNEAATAACEPLTVTQAAAPIVNVVKSEPTPGDGQTVTPGQSTPITYKLAVTNSGTQDALNVVVTDTIPVGTTYVASSAGPSTASPSISGSTITWTIPSLSAISGSTPSEIDLTFQVTVDSSDADGSTITNQASFSDVNTPGCDADTCLTNTVTNKVAVVQTSTTPQQQTTTTTPPTTVVTPTVAKPALAFTGAHTGLLSLLGAGLIGTGGAVLAMSRRRRPSGNR